MELAHGCTTSEKKKVSKEIKTENIIIGKYTCLVDTPELFIANSSLDDERSPNTIEDAVKVANGNV